MTKESLARMLNQLIKIIVSFLEFYKKIKDVVGLLKCEFMTSFFVLVQKYLVYKVCVAN